MCPFESEKLGRLLTYRFRVLFFEFKIRSKEYQIGPPWRVGIYTTVVLTRYWEVRAKSGERWIVVVTTTTAGRQQHVVWQTGNWCAATRRGLHRWHTGAVRDLVSVFYGYNPTRGHARTYVRTYRGSGTSLRRLSLGRDCVHTYE